MNHIIPIPTRREVRIATDGCVARWARAQGFPVHAAHATLSRYGGRTIDLTRITGAQTRRVLLALYELSRPAPVGEAAPNPPAGGQGPHPLSPSAGVPSSAGVAARGGPSTASTGPAGGGDAEPAAPAASLKPQPKGGRRRRKSAPSAGAAAHP